MGHIHPGKLIFIGLGIICRIFSEFQFFLKKLKIFKSLELFLLDFAGQTVWCTRCRKSWIFRKSRFRRVALRCSMWNHPFFLEIVFLDENLWFLKKFFCSKLSKNHSEFDRRKKKYVLLPDSRIEKSHQIEPRPHWYRVG